MKLTDIYAPYTLEFLAEGAFDSLPPGFKRAISGIVAGVLLVASGARAHELPTKSKQTAQIVATMDQAEYDQWSTMIHALGLNMKPENFKDKVGVDYKWLRNRLKNGSPEKVAKALQGADTRLMKYAVGDKELWLRPNELEKAKIAVNFLVSKGLNRLGAVALVGGFVQESRLNEKASNKGAFGIAQWMDTRQEGLPETFMGQLGHVWKELNSTEKKAFGMLQGANNLQDAIQGAARYERFNRKHEWGDRVAYTILLDKLLTET